MTLAEPIFVLGAVAVAALAIRGHAAQKAARMRLFDKVRSTVDAGEVHQAADGFPYLRGSWRSHPFQAELIPDSMTVKRLPQLWLKLTFIKPRKIVSFAALVRPNGAEFYSLANRYKYRLEQPHDLQTEVLIKGSAPEAQRLLDRLSPVLAQIFADKRVKEIAVTDKGLRLVWQAVEGHRGHHLILRQLAFPVDAVDEADFDYCLRQLARLDDAVTAATNQ